MRVQEKLSINERAKAQAHQQLIHQGQVAWLTAADLAMSFHSAKLLDTPKVGELLDESTNKLVSDPDQIIKYWMKDSCRAFVKSQWPADVGLQSIDSKTTIFLNKLAAYKNCV